MTIGVSLFKSNLKDYNKGVISPKQLNDILNSDYKRLNEIAVDLCKFCIIFL